MQRIVEAAEKANKTAEEKNAMGDICRAADSTAVLANIAGLLKTLRSKNTQHNVNGNLTDFVIGKPVCAALLEPKKHLHIQILVLPVWRGHVKWVKPRMQKDGNTHRLPTLLVEPPTSRSWQRS